MKEDINSAAFKGWPFSAEERREDGEINNGAINLVLYPEKIDLIHEATEKNGLRQLLLYLNRDDGAFITLGCSYGQLEDGCSTMVILSFPFVMLFQPCIRTGLLLLSSSGKSSFFELTLSILA